MITFKPIIVQGGRRKDGTWPVYIRITFKGKSRRLPTTLVCTDADLTRSGKIKTAGVMEQGSRLIAKMRATLSGLSPFTLEAWEVDDVVAQIRKTMQAGTFKLDFFAFGEEYLNTKRAGTRKGYDTALNTFARFLGKRECDINAISRKMVVDFVRWCEKQPYMHHNPDGTLVATARKKVAMGASSAYVGHLSHIYEAAKWQYNDEDSGQIVIPRSPFSGMKKVYPAGQG